jgi:hypothetical protein
MFSGTNRSCRVMATFAVASLLSLTAACGGQTGDGTGAAAGATTGSAGTTAAATKAPSGAKVDITVAGTGMKGGCDAVQKIFVALGAGDRSAAESLKAKGDALFEEVAATASTGDLDVAMDGATMASEFGFSLPEGPIYQSELAKQYAAICVAEYGAAALPG